jgi:uncharacterized RDD family membrane protein YckC
MEKQYTMPYCPKCGREVSADAKFCTNCGATLGVAGAAAPQPPSSGYVPPSPLADLGSRIVAGIVDYIIIVIIAGILAIFALVPWVISAPLMMGRFGAASLGGLFGILGLMWLLWLIYFTYFEGTSGQTIGKRLMHIRVIKEDGSRCDIGSALVRNILRIVDHLPFLYILGIILIAATEKRQRLGDMLGRTIVIKA